jgi:hypothetical protein
MVCQKGMGYGIQESLFHLAGNQLSGHEKVWVMGGYGLSQVWVKTELTVVSIPEVLSLHEKIQVDLNRSVKKSK